MQMEPRAPPNKGGRPPSEHIHIQEQLGSPPLAPAHHSAHNRSHSPGFCSSLAEQQREEELRAAEIKRKIRQTEVQIQRIAENKDKLMHNLQNHLALDPYLGIYQLRQPEPQVLAFADPHFQQENKAQNKQITHMRQNAQTSISIQQDSIPTPSSFVANSQPAQDYTSQLMTDTQKLRQQLHMVNADLARVSCDKQLAMQRLFKLKEESESYHRRLREFQGQMSEAEYHEGLYETRRQNQALTAQLKDTSVTKNCVLQNLNFTQEAKQRCMRQNDDLQQQLSLKVAMLADLQQQTAAALKQIDYIEDQRVLIDKRIRQDHNSAEELRVLVEHRKCERNELMTKLQRMQMTHEHLTHDTNLDQRQRGIHHKRHLQLLAMKRLFSLLEIIQAGYKQFGMNEFLQYCQFDSNCHQKLKSLSGMLQRRGALLQKQSLQKWFQIAHKPITVKKTQEKIALEFGKQRIRRNVFSLMKQYHKEVEKGDENKLESVKLIWRARVDDIKKDIRLAFSKMRDAKDQRKAQIKSLHRVVRRQESNLIRQAIAFWYLRGLEHDSTVRINLLLLQCSHEQLLTIALNQLKIRAHARKVMRRMRLRQTMKAWRDSRAYRKYIMCQTIVAKHMYRQALKRLIQSCFDAMRQSKQNEKYMMMHRRLTLEVQPAIADLVSEIENRAGDVLHQYKIKCIERVIKQVNCQVASYFTHWRLTVAKMREVHFKNFRNLLIKKYRNLSLRAFELWAQGDSVQTIVLEFDRGSNLLTEGKAIQSDIFKANAGIIAEAERWQKSQRICLNRAINIHNCRVCQYGIDRWATVTRNLRMQEQQGAQVILDIVRNFICRQGFALYRAGVRAIENQERIDAKCDHYLQTKRLRKKRTLFNAFLKFWSTFDNQTEKLGVLLNNIDVWVRRRTLLKWQNQGNLKTIQLKTVAQHQSLGKFDGLNESLGRIVRLHSEALDVNKAEHKRLKDQGQRILANTFARFYYVKAERGLKQWKDVVSYQRHRESMLRNRAEHLRRFMFYYVKASFQNWVSQCRHQETREKTLKTLRLTDEVVQGITFHREEHEQVSTGLYDEIQHQESVRAGLSNQRLHLIATQIRKGYDCDYMCRKRLIIQQWNNYIKRRKAFIRSIDNIITKSLWHQGLTNISAFANDKHLTRAQNTAMVGMKRMFFKKLLSSALYLWRESKYCEERKITRNLTLVTAQEIKNQANWVEKHKDWNGQVCFDIIKRQNQRNQLKAWRNVVKWFKLSQRERQEYDDQTNCYVIRRALKQWSQRQKLTAQLRARSQTFALKRKHIYLKACYAWFKQMFSICRNVGWHLTQVYNKFRSKNLIESFQIVKNFVRSKQARDIQSKSHSAIELCSSLHQLWKRKMTAHVHLIQRRLVDSKRLQIKLNATFGLMKTFSQRQMFHRWRMNTESLKHSDEVDVIGPQCQEVLKWQQVVASLKQFCLDESYTPDQVSQIHDWAHKRQSSLLAMSVSRLQHNLSENQRLKPIYFDRLKQIVKLRKLLRYLLRNMINRLSADKADLSIAFNRWKFKPEVSADKDRLVLKLDKNQFHKNTLEQLEQRACKFLDEMGSERDELVEVYINSQRLGLASCRDNREKGLRQGLSRLFDNKRRTESQDLQHILRERLNQIGALKQQIADYETDNNQLSVENEELRQFSRDGYAIAKSLKKLSEEREKLSVDLSDKSNTIQALLDQNERLQLQLKQAQANAVNLISESNGKIRRLKAISGRY